jgi:hypothetical protein
LRFDHFSSAQSNELAVGCPLDHPSNLKCKLKLILLDEVFESDNIKLTSINYCCGNIVYLSSIPFHMKKYFIVALIAACSVGFISWGVTGHRTIGVIAEKHLTQKAKEGIKDLLGDQSLADVSTYADEIRSQEQFKYTAPYHYINLPIGLERGNFKRSVLTQDQGNVYKAIKEYANDLIAPNISREEKVLALKMIVHFVGDLHQPMHVSRAEDKGGNAIHTTFLGSTGNLHGLWDSQLIDHMGLNDKQLAAKIDHATPEQITEWQHQDILDWMYESYELSSQLYKDVANKPDFDEAYFKAHVPVIEARLEKAGIRLAGILNEAFSGGPYSIIPPPAMNIVTKTLASSSTNDNQKATVVEPKEVGKHLNEIVTTTGTIVSTRLIESNQMTLLNVGADNPNQDFTIVIKSDDRSKFGKPDVGLKGKTVTVTGKVADYHGKPEIFVSDPSQVVYVK